MNGNIHKGHRERIRERYLQEGPDGFADHEILEMLLYGIIPRGDTNPMAHMLLAEYCCALLAHCTTERFYVICLDSRRRVIHTTKVADGSVVEALVQPRLVMEAALRYRAAGIVFCHNHPGGNARPSFADVELTNSLRELLCLVNIQTVDHIIVAEGNQYYSFSEHEMLKDNK